MTGEAPTSGLHVTDKDAGDRLPACKNIQVAGETEPETRPALRLAPKHQGLCVGKKNHRLILHSTVPPQHGPA